MLETPLLSALIYTYSLLVRTLVGTGMMLQTPL